MTEAEIVEALRVAIAGGNADEQIGELARKLVNAFSAKKAVLHAPIVDVQTPLAGSHNPQRGGPGAGSSGL